MVLTKTGETERKKQLLDAVQTAKEVCKKFVSLGDDVDVTTEEGEEYTRQKVEEAFETPSQRSFLNQSLDLLTKNHAYEVTSSLLKACIPALSKKPFPENNLSLMTISGAKGGLVNFSQISGLLGQQELEGKRPPRMYTGSTLPCFKPYDITTRAGGFIFDRFLTGLRPQEYYFHCMAGREGLLDTAVKTAKSGYLQRCLIKHLEAVRVHYDLSVRNHDNSIIQFRYGEDGIDPMKARYLDKFGFQMENLDVFSEKFVEPLLATPQIFKSLTSKDVKKYLRALKKNPDLNPILTEFNPSVFMGVASEKFLAASQKFQKEKGEKLSKKEKKRLRQVMHLKYLRSLMEPGEAAGLVASQSVGEPSTQMTLNTFHLAGFGGANMTLGIPRMREIIMSASTKLGNMFLPLLPGLAEKANELVKRFDKIPLSSTLKDISLKMSLGENKVRKLVRMAKLKFVIHSSSTLNSQFGITKEQVRTCLAKKFVPAFNRMVNLFLKSRKKGSLLGLTIDKETSSSAEAEAAGEGEQDEDSQENMNEEESAKPSTAKRKEHRTYDDDEAAESEHEEEEEHDREPLSASEVDDKSDDDEATESEFQQASVSNSSKNSFVIDFQFAPSLNMNFMNMVETVVKKTEVVCIAGITKSFVTEDRKTKETIVQTEGVNIPMMWEFADIIDVNKIYSNDIRQMLKYYGVEAAYLSIQKEISRVFGDYGIDVDTRHLSLIADYMTHHGDYRGMNRISLKSSSSPLLMLSFESALQNLRGIIMSGQTDYLRSPSSRIIAGHVVEAGTGCCDILFPLADSTLPTESVA